MSEDNKDKDQDTESQEDKKKRLYAINGSDGIYHSIKNLKQVILM